MRKIVLLIIVLSICLSSCTQKQNSIKSKISGQFIAEYSFTGDMGKESGKTELLSLISSEIKSSYFSLPDYGTIYNVTTVDDNSYYCTALNLTQYSILFVQNSDVKQEIKIDFSPVKLLLYQNELLVIKNELSAFSIYSVNFEKSNIKILIENCKSADEIFCNKEFLLYSKDCDNKKNWYTYSKGTETLAENIPQSAEFGCFYTDDTALFYDFSKELFSTYNISTQQYNSFFNAKLSGTNLLIAISPDKKYAICITTQAPPHAYQWYYAISFEDKSVADYENIFGEAIFSLKNLTWKTQSP